LGITRRKLLSDFAYIGCALAIASEGSAALTGSARAQPVSIEDLNNPGPLPDMILGSSDSPVTIIEYASMTCSHCAYFAVATLPYLKARYIDTGKVRYIFREFPLDELAAAASLNSASPTRALRHA
jgi:protein-disulfide isomerase